MKVASFGSPVDQSKQANSCTQQTVGVSHTKQIVHMINHCKLVSVFLKVCARELCTNVSCIWYAEIVGRKHTHSYCIVLDCCSLLFYRSPCIPNSNKMRNNHDSRHRIKHEYSLSTVLSNVWLTASPEVWLRHHQCHRPCLKVQIVQ